MKRKETIPRANTRVRPYTINDSRFTSHILIACSGGIDSVFLLHYLSDLKKNENLILHACYVDHKLRPESVSESKFVDKICHKLEIPFHFVSFDDRFWADSKKNMEERARKERYRLLYELAVDLNCEYIATGHHLDDQVETVLMRLFDRGTGIKGLVGIKDNSQIDLSLNPSPKGKGLKTPPLPLGKGMGERSDPKGSMNLAPTIKIIRPLLHMSRKEIKEQMKGKEYISDISNDNTDIRRNYFRKRVVPAIENVLGNDEFKKHVYNLSLNVQREMEFTKEMAREFWKDLSPDNQPGPSTAGSDNASLQPASNDEHNSGGYIDPPLRHSRVTHYASRIFIPRKTIEKYSDNFWLTAFSYLFSQHRDFSHCTDALIDIVKFIRKKEPAKANYDPFIFIRNREGVRIKST